MKISFWFKLARYHCTEWFFPSTFFCLPPSHKESKEIEWKMNDDKISNFHIFHGAPSTEWGIYCIEKNYLLSSFLRHPHSSLSRVQHSSVSMRNMEKKVCLQQGGRDRLGAQLTPQMYIMENFQLSFSPEQRRELNENGKFLHFAIFFFSPLCATHSHSWIEYIRWFHKSFKIGSEDEWKFSSQLLSLSLCQHLLRTLIQHTSNICAILSLILPPACIDFPSAFFPQSRRPLRAQHSRRSRCWSTQRRKEKCFPSFHAPTAQTTTSESLRKLNDIVVVVVHIK